MGYGEAIDSSWPQIETQKQHAMEFVWEGTESRKRPIGHEIPKHIPKSKSMGAQRSRSTKCRPSTKRTIKDHWWHRTAPNVQWTTECVEITKPAERSCLRTSIVVRLHRRYNIEVAQEKQVIGSLNSYISNTHLAKIPRDPPRRRVVHLSRLLRIPCPGKTALTWW